MSHTVSVFLFTIGLFLGMLVCLEIGRRIGIRRMKDVMRRLAQDGAAIILSSHLLSLVEEVCTHLLILKDGVKMADGTVAEVHARFSDGSDLSLEEVFFRATGDNESSLAR